MKWLQYRDAKHGWKICLTLSWDPKGILGISTNIRMFKVLQLWLLVGSDTYNQQITITVIQSQPMVIYVDYRYNYV